MNYYGEMINMDCITVVSLDIYRYSSLMRNNTDFDYIATCFHVGFFAMQHKKRSIILAVGDRVFDIVQTYHINIY